MRPLAARRRQIISNLVRIALDFRRAKTMQNADRINLSEEYRNLCGEAARAANRLEQHTIYRNALMASTVLCLSITKQVKTQHAPAEAAGSVAQSERLPRLHAPFCNNTFGLVSVEMSTANSQCNEPADTPVGNDGNNATTHHILNLQSQKRIR